MWVQGARCQAKRFDDELFWGSPLIVGEAGGKNTDMRVGLSKALQGRIRYTDWVVFSVKYDAQGDERRVRLFVDGEEIVYRDIDSAAPQGTIDNRLRPEAKRPEGPATISITLANFTDGDLYGDRSVNNGAGVHWESAFADMTPAIPDPDTPGRAIKRDSDFQWDWVMIVDEASVSRIAGRVKRLIEEGRLKEDVAGKVGLVARTGG